MWWVQHQGAIFLREREWERERGNYIDEPDLEESDVVPIPVIVLEVSDAISE